MLSILDEKSKYWKQSLESSSYTQGLPADISGSDITYSELEFDYPKEDVETVLKITGQNRNALFAFLLSSVCMIFRKYAWNKEIRIGVPRQEESGEFLDILPLNLQIGIEETLQQIVNSVQKEYVALCKNADVTREQLGFYEGIDLGCESVVAFEGVHIPVRNEEVKLYLLFSLDDSRLHCRIQYDANTYRAKKVERFAGQLKTLLSKILTNRTQTLTEADITTEADKELLLKYQTGEELTANDETFTSRIKLICGQYPDKTAIVDFEKSITYKELWKKSGKIVSCLREHGVKRGDVVGIQLPTAAEFVVAMVALMRMGVTYLPMDEDVPAGRSEYYLSNSNAKYVITDKDENSYPVPKILADTFDNYPEDDYIDTSVTAQDILYIIYTSGSTGEPKGSLLTHLNLISLVHSVNRIANPTDKRDFNVGQLASFSFDPSEAAILLSLFSGYTLYVIPQNLRLDGRGLINYIQDIGFDYIFCSTAHINVLIDGNINKIKELKVRYLNIGGEVFRKERAIEFCNMFSENTPTVLNVYGLTETAVQSTVHVFDPGRIDEEVSIPVGAPIAGTNVYILDECKNFAPFGAKGEIYIGGLGVGKGYVNNPEETGKRFTDDPILKGGTMYRTGDMGRWSEKGEILFEGRFDNQIKIRGYRVEIEELESVIAARKNVRECAVIVKTVNDNMQLVAYLTLDGGVSALEELKDELHKILPEYMIPSHIVVINNMPLNINGKVDKKLLRTLEVEKKELVPPTTDIQKKLLGIWQELLGCKEISIRDDFFTIGGQSLKMVKMVAMIYEEFGCEISIGDVIGHPTIESLSSFVEGCEKSDSIKFEVSPKKEHYALSSSQKRMYIVHKLDNGGTTYNTPMLLKLEGRMDPEKLDRAIGKIVARHEIFRTTFVSAGSEIVQKVSEGGEFHIEVKEISEGKILEACRESIKPFVLEEGPLIRVTLFVAGEDLSYLFIDMHHIVSDMVTVDLFLKEMTSLYKGEELAPVRFQFKDYSEWMNKRIESGEFDKQEEYWLKEFESGIPSLNLPKDFSGSDSNKGKTLRFSTDEELYSSVKDFANKEGVTLQMVMVSAYALLLSRYTGSEDILIGLPVAARRKLELDSIMGPILNTVLLKLRVNCRQTYKEFLSEVKDKLLMTLDNQEYPLDILVDKLSKLTGSGRGSVYETSFNFYDDGNIGENCFLEDVSISSVDIDYNISHADIDTTCSVEDGKVKVTINYLEDSFDEATIDYFGRHYIELLKSIFESPNENVDLLNMYTHDELEMYSDEYAG